MRWGIAAAILWALDMVIIGVVLGMVPAAAGAQGAIIVPLAIIFLHDALIAVFETVRMGVQGRFAALGKMIKGKAGVYVIVGSLVGCPLANAGNVIAVAQIGPSYATAITAFYPAVGALLAYFFLRERLRWYQWIGFAVCMAGVALLGFNPDETVPGNWAFGVFAALFAVAGWAIQAVFIARALKLDEVDGQMVLQVRFALSVITYSLIVFPALGAWDYVFSVALSDAMPLIALGAVAGMTAMAFYYIGLAIIGATKAMAIDITYAAWTIPFQVLLLGRVPTVLGIVCSITVVAGSIVAASDLKKLFSPTKRRDGGSV